MKSFSLSLAASLALLSNCFAQSVSGTAATDPVGYLTVTCSGSSDTLLSIPFTRTPEYVGTVQSISGSAITVSGTPGWTTNQFVYASGTQTNSYYVLLSSGSSSNPKEGSAFDITANDSNSITVNLDGDTIASVPAGTQLTIIPHWTLGTAFPVSDAGKSFTTTTSTRSVATQILIPNYSGTGINLAPSAIYFFYNNAWRLGGDATTVDHSNDVLIPTGYFILRNPKNNPTTTFTASGSVHMKKHTLPLAALAGGAQDNPACIIRPVDVTLNNTGLIQSGAFVPSTSTRSIKDQLLVYDSSTPQINRSPSKIYYYMNSAWRLGGDSPSIDHGNDVISAGNGVTIRKAAALSGTTSFWQNSPNY